ncbi:MAG: hypothetical protein V3T17_01445 [Pseudomonadales bacterium]
MSGLTASPEDFRQLFLDDTPLLDVRAEAEFEKGAFPTCICGDYQQVLQWAKNKF